MILTSFFSDVYPEVGILGHMVLNFFFYFGGISILFSISVHHFTYPPYKGFNLSLTSPIFVIFCFLVNSHLNWYEEIFHCSFDLHFLDDY